MPDNDDAIADILMSFFEQLEDARIQYCVLRDYERLPESFRSDVDLLVRPEDMRTVHDILARIPPGHGWLLATRVHRPGLWQYFFYPGVNDDGAGRFILQLDIFCEISWKGIALLSSAAVLQRRVRYRSLFIPYEADEAAILLLKDLLSQGRIFPRYRARIPRLAAQRPGELCTTLEPIVGGRMADFLVERTLLRRWDELETQANTARWELVRRALTKLPLTQLARWMRFLWLGHLRDKMVGRTGLFVVVLGPDGSGKTTVMTEATSLVEKLFAQSRRLAFNFKMLPHVGDLRNWVRGRRQQADHLPGKTMLSEGPVQRPYPSFRVLASLAYHTVGYLLGYPYLFLTRRLGHLVVMERYVYDYFIQPRFRRLPRWMPEAVRDVVPRPDAVIYLHGDPQLIRSRKPELPVDEIERQQCTLHDLMSRTSSGHEFDVGAPVSSVARAVALAICRNLGQKAGWGIQNTIEAYRPKRTDGRGG